MVTKSGSKRNEVSVVPRDWRSCDISDLCQLQRGFDITEATRKPGTVPVYSSSGLSYYHNEAKLQPPAVITGRKGLLGKVFFVEEPCWPHDTTLWVKDFKGNDPQFVSIFLSHYRLERFDAATSVPTLNRNNLIGYPILLPPLHEQRAIASALRDVYTARWFRPSHRQEARHQTGRHAATLTGETACRDLRASGW